MALIDDTRAILGELIAFPTVSSDSNLDLIRQDPRFAALMKRLGD